MPLSRIAALPARLAVGLNRWDLAGIAIGILAILVSCVVATQRDPYFWYDEVATASLIRDPSLPHMMRAIADGAENNPPLYPLVLRTWSALFGTGALALRSLSALALAGALAVTWRTLRRAYPTHATAMGVAAVFFGTPAILEQLAQARFYGLFLLFASIAFALAVTALERATPTVAMAIATAIAHLLLVYTHTFGSFFSGALLAGMIVVGIRRRDLRWSIYAGIVAAWLLFALWAPVLFGGARVMTGRSWIPLPQRDDLIRVLTRQAFWFPFIAAVAVAIRVVTRQANVEDRPVVELGPIWRARETIVVLGLAMIAVIFGVFVLSRLTVPIFLDRYLLPAALGWTAIVAHVVAATTGAGERLAGARGLAAARVYAGLYVALALYPIAQARSQPPSRRPEVALPTEYAGLPIVVEAGHDFLPVRYYAGADGDRYRFLLDLAVATDAANMAGAAQEHHLMVIYRRAGYLGTSVQDARHFVCTTSRFLVIDRPEFLLFERRVAPDSGVVTRQVTTYEDAPVRLVERRLPCSNLP